MYVVVNVTGGQGFLPEEVKDKAVLQQAFAQDIIDRYCNTEYFDPDEIECYAIPSFWYRLKLWLRACPLFNQIKPKYQSGGNKP